MILKILRSTSDIGFGILDVKYVKTYFRNCYNSWRWVMVSI